MVVLVATGVLVVVFVFLLDFQKNLAVCAALIIESFLFCINHNIGF